MAYLCSINVGIVRLIVAVIGLVSVSRLLRD